MALISAALPPHIYVMWCGLTPICCFSSGCPGPLVRTARECWYWSLSRIQSAGSDSSATARRLDHIQVANLIAYFAFSNGSEIGLFAAWLQRAVFPLHLSLQSTPHLVLQLRAWSFQWRQPQQGKSKLYKWPESCFFFLSATFLTSSKAKGDDVFVLICASVSNKEDYTWRRNQCSIIIIVLWGYGV